MRPLFALMLLARVAAADPANPVCGDGIVEGDEACDDGNARTGDGCAALCTVEPGWFCIGSPSTCTTECGDGVIAGAEECDDGNERPNDGCSSHCLVEAGWSCEQQPSTCGGLCGDGIVAGDEECDDGNSQDGDGCTTGCRVESGTEGGDAGSGAGSATLGNGSDVTGPHDQLGPFDPSEDFELERPAALDSARVTVTAKQDNGGCNATGASDLSWLLIASLVLLRRRA